MVAKAGRGGGKTMNQICDLIMQLIKCNHDDDVLLQVNNEFYEIEGVTANKNLKLVYVKAKTEKGGINK
jgi:hypothetical protein